MRGFTNPFDMNPLSLGLCKAEAEGVHCQRRDTEQLHGRANQTGCDHVVYKERTVVREKHTSAPKKKTMLSVGLQWK